MNTILNGCFYLSDVLEKKTDFYILLEDYNIYEEDYIDFFSPENQKYNIINEELIIDMKNEYNNNTEDILKFINYISILRKGEKSRRIENAGFLLLTGTSETLKISKDNRIKEKDIFYFATNLFFITDKLWNGINRGFGNSVFPKSFNIISKAQTVLSTIMRNKISDKYTELKKEVRDGKLTEELAVARLIDLRNYARKPEELDFESIDKALFIITEDKIDNFIQEQTLVKINLEKQNHTIAALNEEIKDKDKILSKYMKSITDSISEKEEILNDLNNKKQKIDFRIKIYSGIFKLSIVFFICFYYFLILKFKLILPEFKMDIITIVLLPLPYIINTIYTFIFMKSFNPLKTVSNIENLIEKKVYSRNNNTLYKITKLKDEIVLLKLGIEEI